MQESGNVLESCCPRDASVTQIACPRDWPPSSERLHLHLLGSQILVLPGQASTMGRLHWPGGSEGPSLGKGARWGMGGHLCGEEGDLG